VNLPAKVDGLEGLRLPDRELHLAIGMFDGVHRGHQSVIREALAGAGRSGGLTGVLTFWPHPSYLFHPDHPVPQIMVPEVKVGVLHALGVDLVIEQPFTPEFAAIPAEEFVRWLQRHLPCLRSICVGENWRFGKGRKGDAPMLQELGRAADIRVIVVPRLQSGDQPISSTRIRECLAQGEVALANLLLGYAYFCEGAVVEGQRLGRKLGFPTLNLLWDPPLKPRFGVYAVRARRAGDGEREWHAGVANYGVRPTVASSGEVRPLLEVHLLDRCPFSAGDQLRVEWTEFLRPEQRFCGVEDLKAQIARDCAQARRIFAR
jgi:riboflavin kinase / FMN adenylyltransferase